MKKLLFLLLFQIPGLIFSQTSLIESYNNFINKAEIEITSNNYEKALNSYLEAFKLNKSPLTKDIFNALVCRLYLNDFEKSKVFLFKLAQKGVSWQALEKKGLFEINNNQHNWKSFIPFYEQFYQEKKFGEYYDYLISNLDSLEKNRVAISIDKIVYLTALDEGESQKAVKQSDFAKYKNGLPLDSIKVFNRQEALAFEQKQELLLTDVDNQMHDLFVKIVEIPGIFENQPFEQESPNRFVSYYIHRFLNFGNFENFNDIDKNRKFFQETLKNQILESYFKIEISTNQLLYWINRFEMVSKLSYTLHHLKVENAKDCEEFDNLDDIKFLKKKDLSEEDKKSYKNLRSQYYLESLEDRYSKEKFAILNNQYFIFPKFSREEFSVMPSCEAALDIIKGAEILKD